MTTREFCSMISRSKPGPGDGGNTGSWRVVRPIIDLKVCIPAKKNKVTKIVPSFLIVFIASLMLLVLIFIRCRPSDGRIGGGLNHNLVISSQGFTRGTHPNWLRKSTAHVKP